MRLSNQSAEDIVRRAILLEQISLFKVEDVRKCNENLVVIYDDLDGNEIVEIDWAYCLFKATLQELRHLFTNFVAVPKNKEEVNAEEL